MAAARQAMVTFAYAALTSNGENAATVLHDDLTTSWGATKAAIVGQVAGAKLWEMRIELRHAFFEKINKQIRVTPVVRYNFQMRYAETYELARVS